MTDSNHKKHLVISKELHAKLKLKALQEDVDLQELTERMLTRAIEE
jgi:predicted HicB family RNase H-like nuclease